MKIAFIRKYTKRETGNIVFVYGVIGTPEQLAAYKASKGTNYKEADKDENGFAKGSPLFFATRYHGKTAQMVETKDKSWVVDTTQKDMFLNVVAQCKGNVEAALHILKMEQAPE